MKPKLSFMNRPYIIVHMMESVDGRIDCAMTEKISPSHIYYDALEKLECPSQLMGRVTMQTHYAEEEPFVAADPAPFGRKGFHKAVEADGYTVAVDTKGRLRWPQAECDGAPLLVITGEDCPKEYLDYLAGRGISWIAVGKHGIDFQEVMRTLCVEFGVERLAITGGGHINGAFLAAGLVDEVSVMIGPGIDGRGGMAAVFDGVDASCEKSPFLLRLESVEKVGEGTVWLRYRMR